MGYETNLAKYQIGASETIRGEFFDPNLNEGAKYYFSDALGSTTALAGQVNGNWTATNRYDYDAWGKASSAQQSNNSIGYTGQRLDSETGLMALGNGERYYSPTLARFIQQDSWTGSLNSPESLNRFSYAYNNPNKFTDPSGNIAFIPILIGIAVFAAAFSTGVTAVDEANTVEKRNDEQIKQGADPANLPNPTVTAVANSLPILPQLFKATTGQDPISGDDLSGGWRAANVGLAALEVLPYTKGGSKLLGKIGEGGSRFVSWLGKNGRSADEVAGAAPKAVKLFQESADELGSIAKPLNNSAHSFDVSEDIARIARQFDGEGVSEAVHQSTRTKMSARVDRILNRKGTKIEYVDQGFPGMYDPAKNKITLAEHKAHFLQQGRAYTDLEKQQNLVHETRHAMRGNRTATQYDEYLAITDEFIFQIGRKPSLRERLSIIEDVVPKFYPNLVAGELKPIRERLVTRFNK